MKDDTLILLGALGIGGYFLYKQAKGAADAITGAPAAFGGALFDAGAGAANSVQETINNAGKAVTDVVGGAGQAVIDTIRMPPVIGTPFPKYITDQVAIAAQNKGLVTQVQPKVAVIDSQAPQWKNDLAINLQTQKFGYIPSTNFDSGLLIPDILNRQKAVYTGGGIAPKVVDIRKTYEYAGVPYATLAQQTGQNMTGAQLSSYLNTSGTKLTAVSVAPSSSSAPTKASGTTGTTSSTASTNSGAHYNTNLKVWVDNKTAKIVGKKAVGVWK